MKSKIMLKCLEEIFKELEAIRPEDYIAPIELCHKSEKVIGVMSDEAKRLQTLRVKVTEEGNALVDTYKDREPTTEEKGKYMFLRAKHELLDKLLWLSVKLQIQKFDIDIGIRSDWLIVEMSQLPPDPMAELAKALGLEG
jgi:hypothetical protein